LPLDLPSPPTFQKTNPNDQAIQYVGLTSDTVDRGTLYDYASTQVAQRISILRGVSRVDVFGTKGAVRIKADPAAMAARGIAVDDLVAAVRRGTSTTGAGQLDAPGGTLLLRPRGQLESAAEYANLIAHGAGDAAHRVRARHPRDLRVPGSGDRHVDPRGRAARVAAHDVRGDEPARLQPRQPLAHGADARRRIHGRRRHRVPREHRAPHGA